VAGPPGERLILTLLHEEDELVAVDKPPGLASTGRDLDDRDCVQWQLGDQLGHPVWAVHQLDKETSGVLLFVRHKRQVADWQKKLKGGSKVYQCIVHGVPAWERMEVDAPLEKRRRRVRVVGAGNGQEARTTFKVATRGPGHALLEATLHTGRTHQIRVHLQHLGHPLVGEKVYRDPPCDRHPRQALHAWRVAAAGRRIDAPFPMDLRPLRKALGV
tara:strand:+ start:4296 stop:4943 length:648 start_codon:yes stop_codon:yes gene_type:complete